MAMGSKIFPHLALANGRKTVKVKGLAWGIAAVKMKDDRHETFEWSVTTGLIETAPLP